MTQNVLISFQTGHLLVIFTKLNQSRANMRDRGLIFLGINCLIPIQKDVNLTFNEVVMRGFELGTHFVGLVM